MGWSFHHWEEEGRIWRTKSEILLACCGQLHVWCGPDFTVGLLCLRCWQLLPRVHSGEVSVNMMQSRHWPLFGDFWLRHFETKESFELQWYFFFFFLPISGLNRHCLLINAASVHCHFLKGWSQRTILPVDSQFQLQPVEGMRKQQSGQALWGVQRHTISPTEEKHRATFICL